MHSPEEARAKWCPYASFPVVAQTPNGSIPLGSANRQGPGNGQVVATKDGIDSPDNPLPARCIAQRCMAWRWKEPRQIAMEGRPSDYVKTGYCGASGQP